MMHEHDGERLVALELTEKPEQGGHVRGAVLVESMQPHEDWRWCFVDEVYLDG